MKSYQKTNGWRQESASWSKRRNLPTCATSSVRSGVSSPGCASTRTTRSTGRAAERRWQLFGDRSQLVVYDFMFASEWDSPRGLLQRFGFDASPGEMRAPVVCIAECSRSSSPDSIASSAQKCRSGCASVLTKDEVRSSEAARCRDPYRPSWQHEHAADLRRRRLSKVVSTDGSGLASLAAVPEITNTGVHSHPDNAE